MRKTTKCKSDYDVSMRNSSEKVIIVGGGVIGLCAAYYASQRGLDVTVLDRAPESEEGCSFGNAGMVVPSHFIPLAAPGMIAKGMRWMLNPESPFYIKPRLSWDLAKWGIQFWKHANEKSKDTDAKSGNGNKCGKPGHEERESKSINVGGVVQTELEDNQAGKGVASASA
mgnify:CR=1 FL=1